MFVDPELALEHFVKIIFEDPASTWARSKAASWVITETQANVITHDAITRFTVVTKRLRARLPANCLRGD